MLLDPASFVEAIRGSGLVGTMLGVMTIFTRLLFAASSTLPCFVELPLYDAQGNRLAFEVVNVRALELPEKGDLLKSRGPHRMVWKDNRLYFSQGIPITGLELTLDGGRDTRGRSVRFIRKIELFGCQQRTSLQHGNREAGVDVSATVVKGRIYGCPLDDAWWIRALPMYGTQDRPTVVYDGYLRKSDGYFEIKASMRGERHIVIVGRGRDPITSIGVDVVEGGTNNDVGNVNLRGKCPKD